jgi:hypothetical protein
VVIVKYRLFCLFPFCSLSLAYFQPPNHLALIWICDCCSFVIEKSMLINVKCTVGLMYILPAWRQNMLNPLPTINDSGPAARSSRALQPINVSVSLSIVGRSRLTRRTKPSIGNINGVWRAESALWFSC